MSNCYNPGNTTLGTVTATGLTIGQNYMLMIDGNSGDGCEFTISGWSGTGILPVELVDFRGINTPFGNELSWKTLTEIKNKLFEVKHSTDGVNYTVVGTIEGSGTTTQQQYYSFLHETAPKGLSYYQLEQIDEDGRHNPSEVITIYRSEANDQIATLYPNPTKESSTVELTSAHSDELTLEVIDQSGHVLFTEAYLVKEGVNQYELPSADWRSGVYIVRMSTRSGIIQKKLTKVQ